MSRETNVNFSFRLFIGGVVGASVIVILCLGIMNFRIEAKDEVRIPKKEVKDSVKYTCPHCKYEVSLTTNN